MSHSICLFTRAANCTAVGGKDERRMLKILARTGPLTRLIVAKNSLCIALYLFSFQFVLHFIKLSYWHFFQANFIALDISQFLCKLIFYRSKFINLFPISIFIYFIFYFFFFCLLCSYSQGVFEKFFVFSHKIWQSSLDIILINK